MARGRNKTKDESSAEGEGKPEPKKANRKRAGSQKTDIQVGDISEISGTVQVAGRDIVTHEHYEEASAAKTEKEFERNELEELRLSILEKQESLKTRRRARLEAVRAFHPQPLALNEGSYLLGRAEFLDRLIRRLRSGRSAYVSGRGGIGRTSLLQAGLMPHLLEQGDLPLLVSVSREPLELSIKRSILTGVDSTTYLKRLSLAKFLEQTTKVLPGDRQLVLLLDDFENVYERRRAEELQGFETEWGYARSNPKLAWVFSIDRGFRARLAPFQPDEILEVPPLDRAAAEQAFRGLERDGRALEDAYLQEILNELGDHREPVRGASINPSELQVVLRALAESDPSQALSKVYEQLERVSGIFEDYLVRTIDQHFIPAERPIVWQILTFLREEYGTPVSVAWLESQLSAYGFDTKDVPGLLRRLRTQHVISAKEESYELAHVSLMRGIQKWLKEQTLLKNARAESIEQLNNIRASALRGMFGGALGFGLFRWIVGGPVADPTAFFLYTLLYGVIGGLGGLLLTFLIDVFIARHRGSRPGQRYLLSALTGLVTFGLALAFFVYLSENADNKLLQFLSSAIVGGAWGVVTGAGIAWALSSPRLQKWKVPVIALGSAFTLYLFDILVPVLNRSTSLEILAGGFWVPFVILASVLLWKRLEPE